MYLVSCSRKDLLPSTRRIPSGSTLVESLRGYAANSTTSDSIKIQKVLADALELKARLEGAAKFSDKVEAAAEYPEVLKILNVRYGKEYQGCVKPAALESAFRIKTHEPRSKGGRPRNLPIGKSTKYRAPRSVLALIETLGRPGVDRIESHERIWSFIRKEKIELSSPKGNILLQLIFGNFLTNTRIPKDRILELAPGKAKKPARSTPPPSSTGTRSYSTTPNRMEYPNPEVFAQLSAIRDLRDKIESKTKSSERRRILKDYPQVFDELDFVTRPDTRFGLTFEGYGTYVNQAQNLHSTTPPPSTLIDMLKTLSEQKVKGNAAKKLIHAFLKAHQIPKEETLTFGCLLNRQISSNISRATLASIKWDQPASASTGENKHEMSKPGSWTRSMSTPTLNRKYSTTSNRSKLPNPEVREQLEAIRDLHHRVSTLHGHENLQDSLQDYPQVRELLETVLQADIRFNLTFESFRNWLGRTDEPSSFLDETPWTLIDLLNALAERKVTGTRAKVYIKTFLYDHQVLHDESLVEAFGRLLDRKPVPGLGPKVLANIDWGDSTSASSGGNGEAPSATQKAAASSRGFQVALGRGIPKDVDPFERLDSKHNWYASRKLDGVRCITYIDFDLGTDGSTPKILDIKCKSRLGRDFRTLGKVQEQLRFMTEVPGLRAWLENDSFVPPESPSNTNSKRLVLDGEICVMEADLGHSLPPTHDTFDPYRLHGSLFGKGDDVPLKENFSQTVSRIKGSTAIELPRYYVFDLLHGGEFDAHQAIDGLSDPFGKRVTDLADFIKAMNTACAADPQNPPSHFTTLPIPQIQVNASNLEAMIKQSDEEGWEGLMLRVDKHYRGSRTKDILKLKQESDAEYIVQGVIIEKSMRLFVDGVPNNYGAVGSLVIKHKGNEVYVGSGLNHEQRNQWAKDPSSIIGKQICVAYFSESQNQKRPEERSLRFPRLKHVYDQKRDF
ncbi:hypothetical protein BD324DRAFT_624236 [Kockovaella imperatae]|uniref:DNA ligase OB-like domain-containing protein n=1 Tax=Kockovaella imperatae TaxID=4999 RepID=A0A1Y1UIY5_9TREE|nr:hypothetical protein BD324DRAFT_624236 [Kockovaella imperatae]ORX38023.1 hypothetical protein BD324DRAFT_624236 [Kockovaella imperatae]